MKSIVFQSNQLSVRGTEIALFDYANYNQSILGNLSVIAYQKNHPLNDRGVIDKFSKKFQMMPYDDMSSLDRQIESNQSNLLYSIKAGQPDAVLSNVVPTMVHAVFPQDISSAHGASYAFVSEWLSAICSHQVIPSVPHIVTLPEIEEDIRAQLGLPKDATVFGCYGGADSFDIGFAKKVVADVLDIRSDIYFIFMNINAFLTHPRAIFLPSSSSLEFKVKFINSCDAMLHARKLGESFGLACAEFSIRNKPIFTYSKSLQRHHLDVLGDKAFLYAGYQSLRKAILDFDRDHSASQTWDCYSERFSPNNIMELFDKHLIQVAERNGLIQSPSFEFSLQDRFFCKYQELKLKSIKLSRLWAS
jgi:hypothetical protein